MLNSAEVPLSAPLHTQYAAAVLLFTDTHDPWLQAFWCMMAFFTIFWWYNVPLSLVFNKGLQYWQRGADNLPLNNCIYVRDDLAARGDPVSAGQPVCTYLTADQQTYIYYQAQSAWYITLVCCQFWHIWNCKTRQVRLAAGCKICV